MADGSDNESSVLKTSCMISSSSLNNNICSESNANSEESVLSKCNALQLAWTGDFPSTKRFVKESLKVAKT